MYLFLNFYFLDHLILVWWMLYFPASSFAFVVIWEGIHCHELLTPGLKSVKEKRMQKKKKKKKDMAFNTFFYFFLIAFYF